MTFPSEVRAILEAARESALTNDQIEVLTQAYSLQAETIQRLTENNRLLRNGAELFRLKATHLEAQLAARREMRPQEGSLAASQKQSSVTLSADATRVMAALAARKRTDFWSTELAYLSRGLDGEELDVLVNELLDRSMIEELSYTSFEGTHYMCTRQGKAWLKAHFSIGDDKGMANEGCSAVKSS